MYVAFGKHTHARLNVSDFELYLSTCLWATHEFMSASF
jgi:hypothetical protein